MTHVTSTELFDSAAELDATFVRTDDYDADILSALGIIIGHGFHDGDAGDTDAIGIYEACVGISTCQ